jgi:hypothetical protein
MAEQGNSEDTPNLVNESRWPTGLDHELPWQDPETMREPGAVLGICFAPKEKAAEMWKGGVGFAQLFPELIMECFAEAFASEGDRFSAPLGESTGSVKVYTDIQDAYSPSYRAIADRLHNLIMSDAPTQEEGVVCGPCGGGGRYGVLDINKSIPGVVNIDPEFIPGHLRHLSIRVACLPLGHVILACEDLRENVGDESHLDNDRAAQMYTALNAASNMFAQAYGMSLSLLM